MKVLSIIPSRNIRNTPVPFYEGELENIPNTYDYFLVNIKFKHIKAREINKSFRSFVSQNARILPVRATSSIILLETGVGIHRFRKLIDELDIKSVQRAGRRSRKSKKS